jgi:hypothetical protein
LVVVVVVSRLVAVPTGVSTVVFEVVVLLVVSAGFDVSTVTLVDDEGGGVVAGGVTTVVVAGGEGSLTTVVEVEAGRSHPARAAAATRATAGISCFIVGVSVGRGSGVPR